MKSKEPVTIFWEFTGKSPNEWNFKMINPMLIYKGGKECLWDQDKWLLYARIRGIWCVLEVMGEATEDDKGVHILCHAYQ